MKYISCMHVGDFDFFLKFYNTIIERNFRKKTGVYTVFNLFEKPLSKIFDEGITDLSKGNHIPRVPDALEKNALLKEGLMAGIGLTDYF